MAGPISVKLSGVHERRWEIVLGQKNIWFVDIEILAIFSFCDLICSLTLSALRTVALRHIYLIICLAESVHLHLVGEHVCLA